MTFKDPWMIFIGLVLLAVIVVWERLFRQPEPTVRFPSSIVLQNLKRTWRTRAVHLLPWLRLSACFLLLLALARPQSPLEETPYRAEGIDIVLVLDVSTSMLAEDFTIQGRRYNRIDVVKNVVEKFIQDRFNDRLALVVFSSVAYTLCPLTLDHPWVLENLKNIRAGMLEDGTAIGVGIMVGLNRLKDSKARSKVMILLTDGRNNAGKISPYTAAEAGRALGVKTYTIGAGAKGLVPYPFSDPFGNVVYRPIEIDLDEGSLSKVAQITGGQFFRATDTESLSRVYEEINRLEKTDIEEKGYLQYRELYPFFLIFALSLLGLEIALRRTVLRVFP